MSGRGDPTWKLAAKASRAGVVGAGVGRMDKQLEKRSSDSFYSLLGGTVHS